MCVGVCERVCVSLCRITTVRSSTNYVLFSRNTNSIETSGPLLPHLFSLHCGANNNMVLGVQVKILNSLALDKLYAILFYCYPQSSKTSCFVCFFLWCFVYFYGWKSAFRTECVSLRKCVKTNPVCTKQPCLRKKDITNIYSFS